MVDEQADATAENADGSADPKAVDSASRAAESNVDAAVIAEFERELAESKRAADENWDKFLRSQADLENFRKVAARRSTEAVTRRSRGLLGDFLEVADNLERALAHGDADPDALVAGVEATYRELRRLLDREGVAAIDAMDQPFNPELHEAVSVVAMPGLEEERVISVERAGYTLNDELLRPARVVVGRPPD